MRNFYAAIVAIFAVLLMTIGFAPSSSADTVSPVRAWTQVTYDLNLIYICGEGKFRRARHEFHYVGADGVDTFYNGTPDDPSDDDVSYSQARLRGLTKLERRILGCGIYAD